MNADIPALLRVHDYFRGASDEALCATCWPSPGSGTSRPGRSRTNPEDPVTSVGFILRGRLKSVKVDAPRVGRPRSGPWSAASSWA